MPRPRIDVSIEHRNLPDASVNEKPHPNTCPSCDSHYREDELEHNLRVCQHCGYHFPVGAKTRIDTSEPSQLVASAEVARTVVPTKMIARGP